MFEVSRDGLRQLLERRGKEFAILELLQNAWDQKVTRVEVTLTKPPGSRRAHLRVVDDDPNGFADLSHAYTLFAPSEKKTDATKRGRFNIGEKLVIALCETSTITTTTGCFEFDGSRRIQRRRKTETGSVFEGEMLLTVAEFDQCCGVIDSVIPPDGIDTYFNGRLIERRDPIHVIERKSLRTEIADDDGYLRATTRVTDIRIYEPPAGQPGMIFEMGIPVVETGDDFDIDVQQKVPLTLDRDNVPPAFLRGLRTMVVNAMSGDLDAESANHTWVHEAMADKDITPDAVRDVVKARFGDKVVAFDPSDPEANARAVAAGHTVVHGRSLSKDVWANVRLAGAIPAAGQLFPTHPPAEGDVEDVQPTAAELRVIDALDRLARALLGFGIRFRVVASMKYPHLASYGGRTMLFNRTRLGRNFLTKLDVEVVDLFIHEAGHEFCSNHLDDRYNNALTKLGAKLAFLVAEDPTLLQLATDMATVE
jgi:Histidine kinase-, DNA gyrase B-, and HSP90-like ATPase